MKLWNATSEIAVTLFAVSSLAFGLSTGTASAHGPECKGHHKNDASCPGGGDGDNDQNLQATFNLTIGPTVLQHVSSDNGPYINSNKDHVGVFTGSGPGFRFDTNLQNTNKLSRWLSARHVYMTVNSDTDHTPAFEIDFRFQNPGLDLGSLDPMAGGVCAAGDTCSGRVPAQLMYFGGAQVNGFDALNFGMLVFGATNAPLNIPPPDCLTDGDILVTRTAEMQWTLKSASGTACRFARDANGDIQCTHSIECPPGEPAAVDFSFSFTLDQQH